MFTIKITADTKKDSLAMITKHFGQNIAELYEKNFKDKSDEEVLATVKELLEEYLGEEQAQKEMNQLNNL